MANGRQVGPPLPGLLDKVQLAEVLGTSERHVPRLVGERRIPYLKVGHDVRFDPGAVREWLQGCEVEQRHPGPAS